MNGVCRRAAGWLILTGVLAFGAIPTRADSSRVLTLAEAVQKALASHPVLIQARLESEAAGLRVIQAASARAVQVDAGGLAKVGLSGSANLLDVGGLASSPEPEGAVVSGNVVRQILDFGRSRLETRARRAEVEYFEATVRAEEDRLALEVTTSYLEGLKAESAIAAAEAMLLARQLGTRQAERLLDAGLGSALDVGLARSRLARAGRAGADAANLHRRALAQLSAAIGAPPGQQYELKAPESPVNAPRSLADLLAQAQEERAELAAVDARVRAARLWALRAERERYPRLTTLFSGGWARFSELTLSKLLFAGFGLQLPIFTGGRLRARAQEASLAADKTEAMRNELVRMIREHVVVARSGVETAMEALHAAKQLATQAHREETLARRRFEADLASRLDWETAKARLVGAQAEFQNAQYDYALTSAKLDHATGSRTRQSAVPGDGASNP